MNDRMQLLRSSDLEHLRLLPLILFSAGMFCVSGLTFAVTIHLPRYFASHVGISLAAVGVAFTVVRLVDIVFDPALGLVIDRTHTRMGRYRPWLIGGAPILMLAAYMLFMAPVGETRLYLIIWLLVFYIGTSVVGLAHSAWAASLSGDYDERSRIFGAIQVASLLGAAAVLLVPTGATMFGIDGDIGGIHAMGWAMIGLLPLCTWAAARTPERPASANRQNPVTLKEYWSLIARPSMSRVLIADLALALGPGTLVPIFIFFWRDARGFSIPQANLMIIIFMLAGIIGAPMWAKVAQRHGKHRTIIGSGVLFIICQFGIVQLPSQSVLVFPAMFVIGIFQSASLFLIRAVVADIADEVQLDLNVERSALLFALVASTQKVGGAVAVAITFGILELANFNPTAGATNSPEQLRGLELLYTFAPLVFVSIGLLAFIGYPLTAKRHAEIRQGLDARDMMVFDDDAAIERSPILRTE